MNVIVAPVDYIPATALRYLRAARIIHPFPVALNVAATAALAGIAAGGVPPAFDLARLMVAMFCVQVVLGGVRDRVVAACRGDLLRLLT